jgi:hypothetical protein
MEASEDPAPAIDAPVLLPNIIRYCLSEGNVIILVLDAQFMYARYRAHQFVQLIDFASTKLNLTLFDRTGISPFKADY